MGSLFSISNFARDCGLFSVISRVSSGWQNVT